MIFQKIGLYYNFIRYEMQGIKDQTKEEKKEHVSQTFN